MDKHYCYKLNTKCEDLHKDLKVLKLALDGTLYEIPPAGYLVQYGPTACAAPVSVGDIVPGTIVLGAPFLRNFYSVMDYEHYTISFAVSATIPWKPRIVSHSAEQEVEESFWLQ